MSTRIEDVLGDIGPGRFKAWALRLALIFVGVALLTSAVYTVDTDSEAVVLRFGKLNRTTGPGLHLRLPFGIERVHIVPVARVLKEEFGFRTERADVRTTYSQRDFSDESIMLTGDLNTADVRWVVQYQILDPAAYLFNVRNVASTLRAASEATMRRVVGDRSIDEVLKISREEIAQQVTETLQDMLDQYETGIDIGTLQLQSVNPPKPVEPSFNEVNQALQEQQRIENQAWEIYNKAVPEAEGRAQRVISEAEGYAVSRVNNASGDAARFTALYKAYARNDVIRDVTRKRLYIETMAKILPEIDTKFIVDKNQTGILPLLNLSQEGGQ